MSLKNQSALFKQKIAAQQTLARPTITPHYSASNDSSRQSSPGASPSAAVSPANSKKRKHGSSGGIVYSTPASTGPGQDWRTRVIRAVEFLKERKGPTRMEDIIIQGEIPDLETNLEMFEAFSKHERVRYDEKTQLWNYKPPLNIHDASSLLNCLRQESARGGMKLSTLNESYGGVQTLVEELERESKVLCLRTMATGERSGSIKQVFYNEVPEAVVADQDLKDMWHSLAVPRDINDIARELQAEGLRSENTSVQDIVVARVKKTKKAAGARRNVKITNKHVEGVDLSKDYVPKKAGGK